MNIDLSGQVVLVTGSSRGLGREIAKHLGNSGASVAVHFSKHSQKAEELVRELGHFSKAFQADFSKPRDIEQLTSAVLRHYGTIDVVVNNAAIAASLEEEADMSSFQSNWEKTLQINLISAAAICKLLIPHFKRKGSGRFIHISSRAAFRGDTKDYMAYAASKAGLIALSKSIARAYGKDGIKSFVIAPGFINTEMAEPFIDQYGMDYVTSTLALSKLTEPYDVAPTVVFLASGFMDHATGTSIDINAASYMR